MDQGVEVINGYRLDMEKEQSGTEEEWGEFDLMMRVLSASCWNGFSPAICADVSTADWCEGSGVSFLLCPSIHLSIWFSALSFIHHHQQVFPFLLPPLTVFPHRYSYFLQFLNPLCPSVCWTAVSQKAAHPPSRFSIKRTWRWATDSIKWCEEWKNEKMG